VHGVNVTADRLWTVSMLPLTAGGRVHATADR
jgi:hypothetical protein